MRLIVCLLPLLCGCSTPTVRCDAHLQPINPAAASVGSTAAGVAASAATKTTPARRAP
jgi:hypothetical protein